MNKTDVTYTRLSRRFLELMQEIGEYGFQKYGDQAVMERIHAGKPTVRSKRTDSYEIVQHARRHGFEYLSGIRHDHFGTLEHQLAASAYNAMMEFAIAEQEGKFDAK